jgi:hypothetical protein
MVSTTKIDIPSRADQTAIDALTNIPAGTEIFNTTTGKPNVTLNGGATPTWTEKVVKSDLPSGNNEVLHNDGSGNLTGTQELTTNSPLTISTILLNQKLGSYSNLQFNSQTLATYFNSQSVANMFALVRGRGTEAAKVELQKNDVVGQITAAGVIDNGVTKEIRSGGTMAFIVDEIPTTSACPMTSIWQVLNEDTSSSCTFAITSKGSASLSGTGTTPQLELNFSDYINTNADSLRFNNNVFFDSTNNQTIADIYSANTTDTDVTYSAFTVPLRSNFIVPDGTVGGSACQVYSNSASHRYVDIKARGRGTAATPTAVADGNLIHETVFAATNTNGDLLGNTSITTSVDGTPSATAVPIKYRIFCGDSDNSTSTVFDMSPDGSMLLQGNNGSTRNLELDFLDSINLVTNDLQLNGSTLLPSGANVVLHNDGSGNLTSSANVTASNGGVALGVSGTAGFLTMTNMSSAERDAVPSQSAGHINLNTVTDEIEVRTSTGWVGVAQEGGLPVFEAVQVSPSTGVVTTIDTSGVDVSTDGTENNLTLQLFNNNGAERPAVSTINGRGTKSSKVATVDGDTLFSVSMAGTTTGLTNPAGAFISAIADGTVSATAVPAKLQLLASNDDAGTFSLVEIKPDGSMNFSGLNGTNRKLSLDFQDEIDLKTTDLLLNGGSLTGKFSQTADQTVSNTTVETSIFATGVGSRVIPANTLKAGDSITVAIGGDIRTNGAGENITVRVSDGTNVIADSGAISLDSTATLNFFEIELDIVVRSIGAAGVASVYTNGQFTYQSTSGGGNYVGQGFNKSEGTNFDTTISNTLDVTVQWGAASVDNVITSNIGVIHKVY